MYILSSIVGGIFRGRRRGGAAGDESVFPEVLDMDELERRLREARSQEEAAEPVRELFSEEPRPTTVPATVPTAGPQASPAAEPTASPTAVPSAASTAAPMAAPATPTQKVPSAVKPSAIGGRTVVQPNWAQDADDEWDVGLDDADWDTLEGDGVRTHRPAGARRRPPTPPSKRGALPEPIAAFVKDGHPWQAAFVVSEVLGSPRALAPYRTFPRT